MVSFCILCFKFLKLSKMYSHLSSLFKIKFLLMVMYYNVIGSWFLNRRFSLHDLLSSVEARKEEYFVTYVMHAGRG